MAGRRQEIVIPTYDLLPASYEMRDATSPATRVATSTADTRLAAELELLESKSQLRRLEALRGIDLTSNDYLGLARDHRLKDAVIKALQDGEAAGATGSRLLSGNAHAWEQLEAEFAEYIGREAALFFNSGYAANTGLLGALLRPEDLVFSDSANHASIIDGIRLSKARKVIFPHLDLTFLEDRLRDAPPGCGKFVVIESVFSMEGDRAPLHDLAALACHHGAELIVDEAHATGVFGAMGRGLVNQIALPLRPIATVHTCGKALGSAGAFVACSKTLKGILVNRARPFLFSTALPPYFAAQLRTAIQIVRRGEHLRERLHSLADDLRARVKELGLNTGRSSSQIVPVILGSNERAVSVARHLNRAGFAVRAIRPPTVPPGTARLRLSVNVGLSFQDLDRFAQELEKAVL
jgi:8-amino-7-oxononanoate synthase